MFFTAMDPPMFETFTALLLAHVLADFSFQTNWMVRHKHQAKAMVAHGLVVGFTLVACLGSLHLSLLWLTLLHMAIDYAKIRTRPGLPAFMLDQTAHLLSITTLTIWLPNLWQSGIWAAQTHAPAVMALIAGGIIAIRAGGFAIGVLMQPFANHTPEGLPGGGRLIGQLERGLIFAMVLLGQPEGVGLLIAAKSILRFGTVKDDRAASEYVIIGTLASFGWALLAAHGTESLLNFLPPLGIPSLTP
jgi:hypothetical protein